MRLAVFFVHRDAGGLELTESCAFAAADALFFVDVDNAVFIDAHGFVFLGTCLIAGMIFAMFADVNFVGEFIEFAEFYFDSAMAGAGYAVVDEGAEKLTTGATNAMAVFIGILNDMVVFHE